MNKLSTSVCLCVCLRVLSIATSCQLDDSVTKSTVTCDSYECFQTFHRRPDNNNRLNQSINESMNQQINQQINQSMTSQLIQQLSRGLLIVYHVNQ